VVLQQLTGSEERVMRAFMLRFVGGLYIIGGSAVVIVGALYGMAGAR
jgi:hypothetical protein